MKDVASAPVVAATAAQAPLGGAARLRALAAALRDAAQLVRERQVAAGAVMASLAALDDERAAEVAALRRLLWQASREWLPLTERIPLEMRHLDVYRECLAAHHELRRLLDEARRGLVGWQIDLDLTRGTPHHVLGLRTHVR